MMEETNLPESPKWGNTTKLIVGLTIVGLIAAMVFYFRQIIGPVLLAFILAFLLQPVAGRIHQWTRLSWRTVVGLIFILFLIIIISLTAVTGYAIIQQAQSLIVFILRFANDLPGLIANISTQEFTLGPFTFGLAQFDLVALAEQALNTIRPLLGQAGSLVSKVAASAASSMGWTFFTFLIAYFLLSETGQFSANLVNIEIPGYNQDVHRLGKELAKIWDAFLRGQLIISLLVIFSYYIMLTILGARLTLVIAFLAGAARFVPYVGPLVTWSVTFIVTFLQPSNYFGLEPVYYALVVLVACLVLDQIFDNIIVPKFLGDTLGVHPAGVLIAALVAARLLGIIGLVLAAPVLATINLLGRYILRKMFDLEPWPEPESADESDDLPVSRALKNTGAWIKETAGQIARRIKR
jgi:predicted PurR-regulated permease PerM